MAILRFVVLTIGAFFHTVHISVVSIYGSIKMSYLSDRMGVTGPLGSACLEVGAELWTILTDGIVWCGSGTGPICVSASK